MEVNNFINLKDKSQSLSWWDIKWILAQRIPIAMYSDLVVDRET